MDFSQWYAKDGSRVFSTQQQFEEYMELPACTFTDCNEACVYATGETSPGRTWVSQKYHKGTWPESSEDYCFGCAYWLDKANTMHDGVVVVRLGLSGKRYRYTFDPKQPFVKNVPNDCRGHGGRIWKIKFDDGRLVTTNNLWSQTDVPERFYGYDNLQVNAKFV